MNPFFTGKHQPIDAPQFRAFVVSLGCAVQDINCEGVIQPHHEPPVGCGGSDGLCIPLCNAHHRMREKMNVAFYPAHCLDIEDIHRRIWDGWILWCGHGGAPLMAAPKRKARSRGPNIQPLTKTVNRF